MSLPMIPEPLEVSEFYFPERGYWVKEKDAPLEIHTEGNIRWVEQNGLKWVPGPPIILVKCPAWGCDWQTHIEGIPSLWMEHLASHRYAASPSGAVKE